MGIIRTIGTGDAFSTGGRFQSCFLVEEGPNRFLVDCGANGYLGLVQSVPDLDSINAVLITHFHGDHYGGVPFILIKRRFFSDKSQQLKIFAPQGARERIRNLSEALYPGLGEELVNQENLVIEEYRSREPFGFGNGEIEAIPVVHAADSLPHGFKIKLGGRQIGFSGDSEWTDSLMEIGEGTDLMMLECNNFESIRPGHVTYTQILENKSNLPENLVLNHFGEEMLANKERVEIPMAEDGGQLSF